MPDYEGRIGEVHRALSLINPSIIDDISHILIGESSKNYIDFLASQLTGRDIEILVNHPNTFPAISILYEISEAYMFVSGQ